MITVLIIGKTIAQKDVHYQINTAQTVGVAPIMQLRRCVMKIVGWLVGFVALRPKSTAKVIAGRSVHLTTLFPGQA